MNIDEVPVLILCGGLGTRLQSVLPDSPKVLAPVGDKFFIDYLFSYLKKQGVSHVILALGHKAENVKEYLRNRELDELNISVIVEPRPLGTAGAVRFVLKQLSELPAQLIVMNGDTFIDADLSELISVSERSVDSMAMMSVFVNECGRYGELSISNMKNEIVGFKEKNTDLKRAGYINGGVYFFGEAILRRLMYDTCDSLEKQFFPNVMAEDVVMNCFHEGVFLDIGTPESFSEANENYKKFEGLMF